MYIDRYQIESGLLNPRQVYHSFPECRAVQVRSWTRVCVQREGENHVCSLFTAFTWMQPSFLKKRSQICSGTSFLQLTFSSTWILIKFPVFHPHIKNSALRVDFLHPFHSSRSLIAFFFLLPFLPLKEKFAYHTRSSPSYFSWNSWDCWQHQECVFC